MSLGEPPFSVRTYGWVKDRPRHFTPGTKDRDTMLILNVEGLGHYESRSQKVLVKPGMVGLIPPDDPGVLFSDVKQPYVHAYCRFGGVYAQSLAEKILRERGARFFVEPNLSRLVQSLRPLPHIHRKELPAEMGAHELGLASLLVTLAGGTSPVKGSGLTRHALLQYLETNMDGRLKLSEMAAAFQMTKPALCRAGKKLLGDTIVKTSHAIRMTAAMQLFETTAMNVTEVAHRVGFDDPYYFSRVFKSHTGVTPRTWRREVASRSLPVHPEFRYDRG